MEPTSATSTRQVQASAERERTRAPTSVVSTLAGMERKLATVLFVDLVGSTALVVRRRSGGRAPPRRRGTSTTVATVSTTHGGIVEKFAGDAVLAAFGVAAGARGRRRARHPSGARRSSTGARASGCRRGSASSRARSSSTRRRVDLRHRRGRQPRRAAPAGARPRRDPDRPRRAVSPAPDRRRGRAVGPVELRGPRPTGCPSGASSASADRGAARSSSVRRAADRARRRARAARQHLRARRPRPPRAPRSRSTASRASARAASRASSSTGSRARPCSPAAACPYGEGITYWPLGRDGQVGRRDLRRRPGRGGDREAPHVLRGRGRRRPARARRRRARGGRERAQRAGDRLGRARVGRPARRTCSRSCSSSRTSTGRRSRCFELDRAPGRPGCASRRC